MAILAECPFCHKKQSAKNRLCSCGADLIKEKRSKRVKYWITYRLPGGKQRRELVGYSIEEARDAEGKRRGQKRENRIFDVKPETKMTFGQLRDWYCGLEKVKALSYFPSIEICLKKFNDEFGNYIVSQIKPADLENLQAKRKAQGKADATIDHEIGAARTMIVKAFDNDLVSGETLRTFKKVKKLLKRNANARDKILPLDQFKTLLKHLPPHTKAVLTTAFYTGMRKAEILSLTWDKIDLKNRVIRLEATDTKDREARTIPICDALYTVLSNLPKGIHASHVFLYNGRPMKSIRRSLENACTNAGIPYGRFEKDGFILHDLRRTFNTYMRKAGVSESVIMEITGHSTREMFDRYNAIDAEDTRQAVDQLQGFLKSVDQNVDQKQFEEERN